jgi:hypothetical protein
MPQRMDTHLVESQSVFHIRSVGSFTTGGNRTVKRSPGFVPVNLRLAGALLLVLGSVILLAGALAALTHRFGLPGYWLLFGALLVLLGLYLRFVVAEGEERGGISPPGFQGAARDSS